MRKKIKLLICINSMYNFNNNSSEAEKKWHQKYLLKRQSMLAGHHMVTQAVSGKGKQHFHST